ncbi:ParA family protein [Acaryochloris sp. CCMEE 5410]|uniref:ParA family protein n=1 Tax=Acaryochloris sp. CCMEE 5410 TaxID=310037 RepID=UPI0002484467|nr:ParA family protein [Acaryochloris sp. CCMEE 5410]KAI9129558.1 ParA family protein [Acaryochloris sp. CCMEE 5410]
MIISLCSFKGGVAKTTTAIHLAFYLSQKKGKPKTLLIDGDPNKSATKWGNRGQFPFKVCDYSGAAKHSQGSDHIVIDTQARPTLEEISTIAEGCDILVLPTSPNAMAMEAIYQTAAALETLDNCRVLLTLCDVRKKRTIADARSNITEKGLTLFKTQIRTYTAYEKAALQGVPVYDSGDPNAKIAWSDYKKLGKEIDKYHA